MTWTVRVVNWREFQHYKDREPPWIKLHRRLLQKPEWRKINGSAAKLLVDVWMLAAGAETEAGELQYSLVDLAYIVRRHPDAVLRDLEMLTAAGFLAISPQMLAAASNGELHAPQRRGETEAEGEQRQRTSKAAPVAPSKE